MPEYCQIITLYVGEDQASTEAEQLLHDAGFAPEIRRISAFHPRAMYGTPVLFGLGNRFEGLDGIRIFLGNAALLGYERAMTA
jgi:hypothetical protein